MLVASNTRYVPTAVNMIVLQGEDEMFYYLHRSLYDQCVILRDQFIGFLPSFYKLLGMDAEHPVVCDLFMEQVPEPLDILGPILSLITGCDELKTIEEMCGAISSMSMSIDFRKMFKVPAQVRKSIKFSLNVREEYRVQWHRFFMETPTLAQVSSSADTSSQRQVVSQTTEADNDIEELENITFIGEELSTDDLLAQLEALEESTNSMPSSHQNVFEEGAEEEIDTPKVKSGFNRIRGLLQ